jgi:hypothetical protein
MANERPSLEQKYLFDEFLKNVINIDQGRLDSLDTSIETIQNYILGSDYGTKVRFFRRQGSLAHDTIIRPLNGQEFDADIVMVVAENTDWDPKDYLLDLRRVLRASSVYREKAHLSVSYSPSLGQISGLFKLLPAPADRFQCC